MDIKAIGRVVTWTFDDPPANSIGESSLAAMERSLQEMSEKPEEIGVLVITAVGRFFSAGVDLSLVHSNMVRDDGPDRMVAFISRLQAAYAAIESLPFPTICIMNGNALGGGLELALSCDLRVASQESRLGLPEIKLGLLPGAGGTQRLPRLIGKALALRLIMLGETIDATEAQRLGVVQWALPASETMAFGNALAAELAGSSTFSLAAIKRCIELSSTVSAGYEAELETTRLLMSDDTARAEVLDFFAKRTAQKHPQSKEGSE